MCECHMCEGVRQRLYGGGPWTSKGASRDVYHRGILAPHTWGKDHGARRRGDAGSSMVPRRPRQGRRRAVSRRSCRLGVGPLLPLFLGVRARAVGMCFPLHPPPYWASWLGARFLLWAPQRARVGDSSEHRRERGRSGAPPGREGKRGVQSRIAAVGAQLCEGSPTSCCGPARRRHGARWCGGGRLVCSRMPCRLRCWWQARRCPPRTPRCLCVVHGAGGC